MVNWPEVVAVLAELVAVVSGEGARSVDRVVVAPDEDQDGSSTLVLAVGRDESNSFSAVLADVGPVAGLVVRARPDQAARMVEDARERSIPTIVLVPDADWIRVIERLRGLLGSGPAALSSDLFEIAAAAAEVVGGPVTIEDVDGRVLAYGGDHSNADEIRIAGILGRRVPAETWAQLVGAHVLRNLTRASHTVLVTGVPHLAPRAAVAIRSGGVVVGSAWAIIGDEPPSARILEDFSRCVGLAALPLVRAAQPPPADSVDADGFAALLYGGAGARRAARQLHLGDGGATVAVLAVRGGEMAQSAALRVRLRARIVAISRLAESHIGDVNGCLFVIVPSDVMSPAAIVTWLEREVVGSTGSGLPEGALIVAGVGPRASAGELSSSRSRAELALAVAGDRGTSCAVLYEDAWAHSFVRRLAELPLAIDLAAHGPVEILRQHDVDKATTYVDTLEAHVLTGGDARRASELLHIHPNTFRYRMRKIVELVPLELDRIEVQAAVSAQLALIRWNKS